MHQFITLCFIFNYLYLWNIVRHAYRKIVVASVEGLYLSFVLVFVLRRKTILFVPDKKAVKNLLCTICYEKSRHNCHFSFEHIREFKPIVTPSFLKVVCMVVHHPTHFGLPKAGISSLLIRQTCLFSCRRKRESSMDKNIKLVMFKHHKIFPERILDRKLYRLNKFVWFLTGFGEENAAYWSRAKS